MANFHRFYVGALLVYIPGKIIPELAHKSPDFVKNRSIGGYKIPKAVDLNLSFHYDENGYILSKDKPYMVSLFRSKENKAEKGQSFVELSLVIIFLMIFVAGVVEFGFMLNNYLNLVDASREAVRYSSDFDPFLPGCPRASDPSCVIDTRFFTETIALTEDVLSPVVLDSTKGDDIVVTFFSVGNGVYIRHPDNQGWPAYGNQVSKLTDAEIQSRLDSSAPPTGVLLVEIFYHYSQVLKLPIFTAFVRDPMPVYVYSIMPLSAAEP